MVGFKKPLYRLKTDQLCVHTFAASYLKHRAICKNEKPLHKKLDRLKTDKIKIILQHSYLKPRIAICKIEKKLQKKLYRLKTDIIMCSHFCSIHI